MKKIKKIVLRSATKLTNSEMKKLRGGYDPIYSPSCRVECPVGSASLDCSKHELKDLFCAPISGAGFYGVGCYADTLTGIRLISGTEVYCLEPETFKR